MPMNKLGNWSYSHDPRVARASIVDSRAGKT